jgi:hypothetical protein
MGIRISYKIRLGIVFILASLPPILKAQSNLAFYALDNHFNSSNFNPAYLQSKERFTFSIFPLAGLSIGYDNQEVTKGIVKESLLGITTDEEYKKVLRSLTNRTSFNQDIESTLLSFTYRNRAGFFNFQIKENQNLSASLKGDVTDFIFNTGIRSIQINQSQYLPAQGMHYREFSLGYSLPNNGQRLRAGIRAKLYFGKLAFKSGLSGAIRHDAFGYNLNSKGNIMLSIPLEANDIDGLKTNLPQINFKNVSSYMLNSGNPGFGFDLGLDYQLNRKFNVSVSAINLGRINWKTNLNSKDFDGKFPLSSAMISSNLSGDAAEMITKKYENFSFADSMSNRFALRSVKDKFETSLPLTVYSGIQYHINRRLKLNLTDRFVYLKELNTNSLALIVACKVNKGFSFSSGYSLINNTYTNIPLAFLFERDFGQIYFGTDDLLSFLIPSVSDIAGFSFGACFYLYKDREINNRTSKKFPFYKPNKPKRSKSTGLIQHLGSTF